MNLRSVRAILPMALCLALAPVATAQVTWVVDDDAVECPTADFASIYEAIAAASPDATIEVCPGHYVGAPPDPSTPDAPGRIYVDKPLTLQGPNTGIDGCTGERGPEATIEALVRIAADHVVIDGFRLTGEYWAAVTHELDPSTNDAVIRNNVFEETGKFGVLNRPGSEAAGWLIEHNKFANWTAPEGAAMRLRNAPNTEIRFNCIYHDDSGMPNAHGIELTAVSGSVVSGNRIGPLTGNGIDLYDWDGPTAPLAIENNEFDRVGTAVKTEGDAHEKAHISIRDNRIIESHWDAITIWSGWYGPLFIESNDIVRGPAEAIHVEGHPWHPYPEVHVNSNRIEDINWAAINLARGHFGFVHVGENIITGTGVGIQMEGQGNGVDQAHINGNTIVDVRGPAISLWPERYDFVHMGFNSIEQDVGMLPWDIGAIDVRLGEHPAGPILVVDNTIGLRGAGPPVFGVYVEGPASELYMAGNDLLAPGVPDATGLTIMTGAPWLPPIPEDTRFRLDCNEFVGFPWGIRVIGPDFLPGGFPPPPAEFVMEQNGFLDVGVAVDNGPPGASADIHAPWNYWGSDDPPPDFPNVAEHPYMLLHDYDFDGNGIRNCKDQDVDADGIPNVEDLCMFTVADELERDLGPNQWRLGGVPGAYAFETERRGSGGRLRSYTLADTRGCSCFDILRQLDARDYFWTTDPGTGDPVYEGYEGHLKKGCSPSVMDAWLVVADGGDPPPMDGPAAGKDGDPGMPASFALRTAYPNPFNPTTTLVYEVPEAARVRIAVHDVLGRVVRVLVDGTSPPGRHRVTFDAGILPSGVYLVRFEHPTGAATRTVQLLR